MASYGTTLTQAESSETAALPQWRQASLHGLGLADLLAVDQERLRHAVLNAMFVTAGTPLDATHGWQRLDACECRRSYAGQAPHALITAKTSSMSTVPLPL